jgi:hypothetical protein
MKLKRIVSLLIILSLSISVFFPFPLSSGLSKISINVERDIYRTGNPVYVFGSVLDASDASIALIDVENPSGEIWASASVSIDLDGNFGTTVGSISPLDSTGTYIVTVTADGITNSTTFQVKTQHNILVSTDKNVYLDDDTISVLGRVSPLIDGYKVTVKISRNSSCEIDCVVSIAETTPGADGTYLAEEVYKVQVEDYGEWIVNVTYGPMASNQITIYVGLTVSLNIEKNEYLPGDKINVSGIVKPLIWGSVKMKIRNPSGGIWADVEAFPNSEGEFSIEELIFPGDQIGEYNIYADYWGITNETRYMLGHLGDSTMKISQMKINGISNVNRVLISEGDAVSINVELINKDIVTHEYVLIVQIKDGSGKLVFIASQSSDLKPGELADQTAGQPLWDKGVYEVKIFVWDSWSRANALSSGKLMNFEVV